MMARFTWLHFTDLHVGQASGYRWPAMRADALEDLRHLRAQLGRVDAVLFTGDLVYSGRPDEFESFSTEMDRVLAVLREGGSDPVLVAVPGNHDLTRPGAGNAAAAALQHFGEERDIRDQFWTNPQSDYRKAVTQAFEGWTAWSASGLGWDRLQGVKHGLLPGDFLATWSSDDLRIGLVGLNSAALQLGGGDYEKKLALAARQLAELEPEIDDWARGHDACLLLTHHPETWLNPEAYAEFRGDIYLRERFALHLCGHNHQQQMKILSEGFAEARPTVLGRSLCGIERLRDGTEDRLFGYSAGQIEVQGHDRTRMFRLWPRAATPKGDGTTRFGPDPHTHTPRGKEHTKPIDLGPSPRPAPPPSWTTPPDKSLLREIAEFLGREYRRPPARRGLLDTAGVEADPKRDWSDLLPTLTTGALRELLLAAELEGAQPLIDRLVPGPPADSAVVLGLLADRFADAGGLLAAEQYEQAAEAYASIAERALGLTDDTYARTSRARALVNRAAALNGAGDTVGFTALLRSGDIAIEALEPRGRINLARMLLSLNDVEGALRAVDGIDEPGAQVIHQLVALHRGEVPPEPADDPDVLLWVAGIELNARRCQRAIDLCTRTCAIAGLTERGRNTAAELIGRALFHHWVGASDEPLDVPGAALHLLEELASGPRGRTDWERVDELVVVCNELPVLPRDRAELDEPAAWLGEFQDALGQPGPEPLRALAKKWPHVGPILLRAARHLLLLEERDDALELARRAFALLPGHGQREALALALLAAGADAEAAQHVEVLAARHPRPEMTWELVVRVALAHDDLDGALQAVLEWGRKSSTPGHGVWEVLVRLRRGEVGLAQAAAEQVLQWDGLSFQVMQVLAGAALATPADRPLAARVAKALEHDDLRRHPAAELLRHNLLLASGSKTGIPIDWVRLQQAGLVQRVSLDEVRDLLVTDAKRSAVTDRAWLAGLLAFEDWTEQRRWPVGLTGLGVRRGELSLAPPVPPTERPPWRGRRVHIGALAIEILVALDLHVPFAAAVDRLVLLDDARDRFAPGSVDGYSAALLTELGETDAWWLPFDGLPVVDLGASAAAPLSDTDLPAVVAWLGTLGVAPRSGQTPWTPPTGTVVLDAPLLLGLHRRGLSEKFLGACHKAEVVVAVAREAVDARNARRREIALRSEAAALAAEAWRWLTQLQREGRLDVRPVPPGPPLPPLASGHLEPWTARAFAARELLRADPELVVVSSELVELGLYGRGPIGLEVERAWTAETRAEHEVRYEGLAGRYVTIARVARELCSDERRPEVVGRLAQAGYPDALERSDVRALYDLYGGLAGGEPRRTLLGTVASIARDDRPMHGALIATPAVLPLVEAILDAWAPATAASDADARTVAMLDVLEAMEDHAHGRERLLDLAVYFLASQSVDSPGMFLTKLDVDRVKLDPAFPGPRMWDVMGAWSDKEQRWVSLQLGVARAIQQQERHLGGIEVVYGVILRRIPESIASELQLRIANPAVAAALNRRSTLPAVLNALAARGRPLKHWVDAANGALDTPTVDGLDITVTVDGVEVCIALEGLVPAILPHAARLGALVAFDDGDVARALATWAERPDETALAAVRVALDRSPLRAVRADPRVILAWSQWADPGTCGPSSIADLRGLLSEPEDWTGEGSLVETVDRRLSPGGAWAGRDLMAVAQQMGRIPGGMVGMARPPVDEETLHGMARLPEEHRHYPTGELVAALRALGGAGKVEPQRRIDDLDVRLPELVARCAAAALSPPPAPTHDYASCEPALVRACASAVDAITDIPLAPPVRIWLSWRLFAWLTSQLLAAPDRHTNARRLAAATPPASPDPAPDPYDPRRTGPDRIDFRELSVLQALWRLRTEGAVDWHLLLPTLLRVASRPLNAEEWDLREGWVEASLGGPPMLAPDLARLLALSIDLDVVSQLGAAERMVWLDDALSDRAPGHPLRGLGARVLLAFAVRARWSDAEAARIRDALADPAFDDGDRARGLLRVAAVLYWPEDPDLAQRAWAVVERDLDGTEPSLVAVQEWLLASARTGRLTSAVRQLRIALAARSLDELPYLARLGRSLVDSAPLAREQAEAVVAELATDPNVAESEVIRWLQSGAGDTEEG